MIPKAEWSATSIAKHYVSHVPPHMPRGMISPCDFNSQTRLQGNAERVQLISSVCLANSTNEINNCNRVRNRGENR